MSNTLREHILVGDVGATKTALAVLERDGEPRDLREVRYFKSTSYADLESIVSEYRLSVAVPFERACVGVPGPVIDGRAHLTNLPWTVDERRFCDRLKLRDAHLLNDVQATAAAIPLLADDELRTVQTGEAVAGGAIAVLAPGTGIGQAFLTHDGSTYHAHPSEGGHSHFSPVTSDDGAIWDALRARFGRVSAERVCSGSGIPNVYEALRDLDMFIEPPWLNQALAHAGDLTAVIIDSALDATRPCSLCVETLNVFVRCLAVESANLAIKVLATGGVYLAGGIPPRIADELCSGLFRDAFCSMGRYTDLMQRMPVHIVMNPGAALLGAAASGLRSTD